MAKLNRSDRGTRGARKVMLGRMVCWSVLGWLSGAAAAQDVRIDHVDIVSPERATPLRNASVLIHNGRIAAISAGTRSNRSPLQVKTVDGTGLYLAPGLIDSHVHLGSIPGMTAEAESKYPDVAKAARD